MTLNLFLWGNNWQLRDRSKFVKKGNWSVGASYDSSRKTDHCPTVYRELHLHGSFPRPEHRSFPAKNPIMPSRWLCNLGCVQPIQHMSSLQGSEGTSKVVSLLWKASCQILPRHPSFACFLGPPGLSSQVSVVPGDQIQHYEVHKLH